MNTFRNIVPEAKTDLHETLDGPNPTISTPGAFPRHKDQKTDPDLVNQLFDRYAKGGAKVAGLRAYAYFMVKKYTWSIVIGSTYFVKRTLDMVISSIMMVLLSPVFLITAMAIKINSRGPVFFHQTRVGKWGRVFTMHKFRSMVVGSDALKDELIDFNETTGVIFKIRRDPRVTLVGRIIRKLSIDELPQLWNVLKGDMSLVGPRPPLPKEVDEYAYSDRKRLDAIPGITCFWQVSGRSEIDFEGQVKLDIQYIESQSFRTDLKILFKTIPAVLFGKGAY